METHDGAYTDASAILRLAVVLGNLDVRARKIFCWTNEDLVTLLSTIMSVSIRVEGYVSPLIKDDSPMSKLWTTMFNLGDETLPRSSSVPSEEKSLSNTSLWMPPMILAPKTMPLTSLCLLLLPSLSHMWEPLTKSIKIGCLPTDLKARTGEFTPPDINSFNLAFSKYSQLL